MKRDGVSAAAPWAPSRVADHPQGKPRSMGDGESEQLMVWPILNLIGFFVLMGLVITLGTVSTHRYEREQRARAGSAMSARRSVVAATRSVGLPGIT